jgi:hypothetical protein
MNVKIIFRSNIIYPKINLLTSKTLYNLHYSSITLHNYRERRDHQNGFFTMKIGEKHRLKIELQSIDSMNYSLA